MGFPVRAPPIAPARSRQLLDCSNSDNCRGADVDYGWPDSEAAPFPHPKIIKTLPLGSVISTYGGRRLIQNRMERADLVRKATLIMLGLQPKTNDGVKIQSLARFELARFDAISIKTGKLTNRKNLLQEIDALMRNYEELKSQILAPCLALFTDECSLAHYELSKLASGIGKLIADAQPDNFLPKKSADEIISLHESTKVKLKSESRNSAL